VKKSISIFLFLPLLLFGALPDNTTTWELRTAGNDNSGGCFVTGASGTDYSQQNAAQFSGTDLVLVTGTTASSMTHNFVAADVGNCIHITAGAGFTAGFYNIVSVAVNVATLGATAGTGGSTGGTWAEGGALASPITAAANITHGNTIYCKADGTYTVAASIIYGIDNNGFNPTRTIGYTTTRTDGGRCSWTTSTNSVDLIQPIVGAPSILRDASFYNLNLSSTAGTPGDGYHTTSRATYNLLFNNCVFTGFKIGLEGNAGLTDTFYSLTLVNVEIKSSTGLAVDTSEGVYCIGCYIHNNGGGGVLLRANTSGSWQSTFISSIIASNTGNGIEQNDNTGQSGRGFMLFSSTLYKNTGDGVKLNTNFNVQAIPFQTINTVYYSNGGYGINNTGGSTTAAPSSYVAISNAFGANTTAPTFGLPALTGTVTLTADPFTSGTNFALNSTAGGGAALKALGFPGILIAGGTGYIDIGPLQSQASSGAGTGASGFVQ
jgi:hypothetical protein